jgi:glycine cleavage system aminomethyltransferase T
VSLGFLAVDGPAVARTPMERSARAAGARFEDRDGWSVAVHYGSPERERDACRSAVGWADVSHLSKLELQGPPEAIGPDLQLGTATRVDGAWWCPLTERRALVLGARPELSDEVSVVDVTTTFAAITLVGPLAREVFARFCALDLRPEVTPVGSFRPGSIARQPGMLLREAEHRYLFLFGWAVGQYMWTVVEDAARHLGGSPVGVAALDA